MPPLTRWAIRAALLYLLAGMLTGSLFWYNSIHPTARLFAAFNPVYIHLLAIGWLTQLIYAVIYWMFPIISKANMRGDPRLAWGAWALLNGGLLLRVIAEPWRALSPNDVNGWLLTLSAALLPASGYLIVLVCWPRIREKPGR